jgi:broad specificity phosphatase PhoE
MASLKQKEFYFIRHGQTDHNCGKIEGEHLDIPLNKKGRSQAIAIEPLVTNLALRLVWSSPRGINQQRAPLHLNLANFVL